MPYFVVGVTWQSHILKYAPRKDFKLEDTFYVEPPRPAGHPDYAVGSSVWLVKPFFVLPFLFEDMIDRKKREG